MKRAGFPLYSSWGLRDARATRKRARLCALLCFASELRQACLWCSTIDYYLTFLVSSA